MSASPTRRGPVNDAIDFEKIFGGSTGFIVVDPADRIDLNEVIRCLPPMCPQVESFTLVREEASAAEATEASCTCH